MEKDDTKGISQRPETEPEAPNIGEASVDPAYSLDALALDDGKDKKDGGAFHGSSGHSSDFSFILSIGSPDSVRSTITMDPIIRFDTSLLDPATEISSDAPLPEIQQTYSAESSNGSPMRRFRPPANANRWMDDSEHIKSPQSRSPYTGALGLKNHLVPIQDTDGECQHEYHDSQNSSFIEVASKESSAFEVNSMSTSDNFPSAPYNDESPDERNLRLKMQQLRATAGTATGSLAEDNNGVADFNPTSTNKYLDSLHSLNTLISQDNIICNKSGYSTSTGSFGVED